jgi:hypothetical protein
VVAIGRDRRRLGFRGKLRPALDRVRGPSCWRGWRRTHCREASMVATVLSSFSRWMRSLATSASCLFNSWTRAESSVRIPARSSALLGEGAGRAI